MIIVEGMDNTGKTTLCYKLWEKFSSLGVACMFIHSPGPKLTREEMERWMDKYLEIDFRIGKYIPGVLIHDRHPLVSELVYGMTLRDKNKLAGSSFYGIVHPKPMVYCRPPDESVKSTLPDREQMEGVQSHAEDLLKGYDTWAGLQENLIRYDFTSPDCDKTIEKIVDISLNRKG